MDDEQSTLEDNRGTPAGSATNSPEEREGSSRVLVKLTAKAVKTDPVLAERKATGGETAGFPSRAAAEEALVTNEQVALQSADANPDKYDYYLAWTRPSETAPEDRGPPEDGWRFQARGNEVGRVAETLLTGVGRRPTPIVQYACQDLGVERSALNFWQGDSLDQFQTLTIETEHSWQPDSVFAVYDIDEWKAASEAVDAGWESDGGGIEEYRAAVWRAREKRALQRIYPLEVKHDSASFGRHQREAMHALAESDDDRVVPLLARVTLDELPQHYNVRLRAGPFTDG
jgi:hypothetical protein